MAALPARRQNFTEKNEIAALWCAAQRKARHFAWDGAIRVLSAIVPDHAGEFLLPEPLEKLRKADISRLLKVAGEPRVGPCVGSVGKFVCIGLNYSDHAKEAGMPVPVEPVVFMKPSSSICSPNDDVVLPRGSTNGDWEVELGVSLVNRGSMSKKPMRCRMSLVTV